MERKRLLPNPSELIASIESKAVTVRDAATTLSDRIKTFEQYLSRIKGRVETLCFGEHPDATTDEEQAYLSLCLKYHRDGKDWKISWSRYHESYHQDHAMDFSLLVDAPVKIKIGAIKLFPDLLEAISKSQDRLVKEIEDATEGFDAFAATLPKLEGK